MQALCYKSVESKSRTKHFFRLYNTQAELNLSRQLNLEVQKKSKQLKKTSRCSAYSADASKMGDPREA